MAKDKNPEEIAAEQEKKRLKEEKQKLKKEQKDHKKEAKRRAKEISQQESALAEDEGGNGVVTFLATIAIVALWIAVICVVVKLDIGGFGSSVLAPILKDVPVVNKILPSGSVTETTDPDRYNGYSSLQEAVNQIKRLELELEQAQKESSSKDEELDRLKAEVLRLQAFQDRQVEFDRIQQQFLEEVIYAENGPGVEAYREYYEAVNPTIAEYVYRQVIMDMEESKEIQQYASRYSSASMDPGSAAKIFEAMTDDLSLVARILKVMSVEDSGAIMEKMDPSVAARLTKIMNPES